MQDAVNDNVKVSWESTVRLPSNAILELCAFLQPDATYFMIYLKGLAPRKIPLLLLVSNNPSAENC